MILFSSCDYSPKNFFPDTKGLKWIYSISIESSYTGKSQIKITKVLNQVSKIFKINKKPVFGNIRDQGHYDVNPYSYIPKKDVKMKIKNTINLKRGILEIIKEIKNGKKK